MISPSSSIASSQPATSAKVVFGMSLVISLALDLANCITRPPPPCMLFIKNKNTQQDQTRSASSVKSSVPKKLCLARSPL